MTPIDGVPIRADDILTCEPALASEAARAELLVGLRSDLVDKLADGGVDVVAAEAPTLLGRAPVGAAVAELGRAVGAEAVLTTELVAYGDIRRSWLWILFAQAVAAGIGHGIVVAAATGSSTYGWWAGAGELVLETATWVGGAVLGTRGIDPVLMRFRLVRTRDGATIAHWTREGTRPLRRWFRRRGEPPRGARLRAVADRVFEKLAPKIERRLGKTPHSPPATGRAAAPEAPLHPC